jgi:excisionase family DNA binding protein
MNELPDKPRLNVKEVAEFWGVDPRTVYRWIEKGVIVAVKKGGSLRIPRESALEYKDMLE